MCFFYKTGKKRLLFRMNAVTYFSLKKIKFLDQVLLLLLVKTVMAHKNIIILYFFFFPFWCQPSKYQSYAFQEHLCRTVLSEVGGVHCFQSPSDTSSSSGETGSWGLLHKRSLWSSGCCQEAERHKASPGSLCRCFVIAGGSKKQTQNFFQFCADLPRSREEICVCAGLEWAGKCSWLGASLLPFSTDIGIFLSMSSRRRCQKSFKFQKLT